MNFVSKIIIPGAAGMQSSAVQPVMRHFIDSVVPLSSTNHISLQFNSTDSLFTSCGLFYYYDYITSNGVLICELHTGWSC